MLTCKNKQIAFKLAKPQVSAQSVDEENYNLETHYCPSVCVEGCTVFQKKKKKKKKRRTGPQPRHGNVMYMINFQAGLLDYIGFAKIMR